MTAERIVMGILAHVDAGKTTLSESILFNTGVIRKAGRVDHRDTFLDTDEKERERGITIFSKQALFEVGEKRFVLLDTPGHTDFSAETERTLALLDCCIFVIDGAEDLKGHAYTLWKLLRYYEVPTFVFINKMDRFDGDRGGILKKLTAAFGPGFAAFPDPDPEEIALLEEDLLEQYLETGKLRDEAVPRLIAGCRLFPCFFGSALYNRGVTDLLKSIADHVPCPEYPEEFGAIVYKISRDSAGRRLTHMKITGGCIRPREMLNGEKIDQIRCYSGTDYTQLERAGAGEIVEVSGLLNTWAGQTLGCEEESEKPFLIPLFVSRLKLSEETDPHSLFDKLRILGEEIPELDVAFEKGEIRVKLMGPVQTEILKSLIKRRFGEDVDFEKAAVVYKETVCAPAQGTGHYEPLRHYAEVRLRIEPGMRGSGIEAASELTADDLPMHFQRLILTHILEKKHIGVLTGGELTDVKITLTGGRAHLKHTEGGDFRQAVYRAVRNGLMRSVSMILEPYYSYELTVPASCTGRAMSDLSRLDPDFEGPLEKQDGFEKEAERQVSFTGRAPVTLLQDYIGEVAAYTAGFGRLSLEYDGYDRCHDPEAAAAAVGYDPEADADEPTGSVFCAHGAGFYVPWDEVEGYSHLAEERRMGTDMDSGAFEVAGISGGRTAAGAGAGRGPAVLSNEELERYFGASLSSNRKPELTGGWNGRRRKNSAREKALHSFETAVKPVKEGTLKPLKSYLLVDGYNIIFGWPELRALAETSLDAARSALLDILCDYQGFKGMTLITVFDAYKVRGGERKIEKYGNIHVVYTKEAETADAYIEKTVHEIAGKNLVTVATSDGLEQVIVFGAGAVRMSAAELLNAVAAARKNGTEALRENGKSRFGESLGPAIRSAFGRTEK